MKILYIGVFSHSGWGAEYWLEKAFRIIGIKTILIDYRVVRQSNSENNLGNLIRQKSERCDLVFLQRGDHLSPEVFKHINIPIVFWSTEPIQLKRDVDNLLKSNVFSWVYVHSYSCLDRISNEFRHLINITSVLHNAAPGELLNFDTPKTRPAIFNRTLSLRRRLWLLPSYGRVVRIQGRFGEGYFEDLRATHVAVNIHYSRRNLDDFESGIFEAMASGCAILSESLYHKTLLDLKLEDTIIQVKTALEMKQMLVKLAEDEELLKEYQGKSKHGILKNTWKERAIQLKGKFEEILYL